jgi:outer membrane scaffolding protein for murein synthesis (MipA/OmpV family)
VAFRHRRPPGAIVAAITATIVALLALPAAHAELLPLWEAGAGVSALQLPDYRGSSHQDRYVLPFPYFIYRGDVLKVDRDGVRAEFLESRRLTIEFSSGGSVPVHSSDDPVRAGMPDLSPTLELGPLFQYNAWKSASDNDHVDLRLPVHRAFGWDRHLIDAGTSGAVQVAWDHHLHFDSGGGNLGFLAGALFGDRRQNSYFYSVAPAYATAQRPAYDARGGYGGWQAIAAFSRRAGPLWFGAFARYDDLSGAVFASSPLVVRDHALMMGAGVAWIFRESAERVEAQQR